MRGRSMQTIRRSKVRDQVAEQIKQYIVEQELGPGDRLPTENQLAETFGISRLGVREATKSLEFLGVVESKTGVGADCRAPRHRAADQAPRISRRSARCRSTAAHR